MENYSGVIVGTVLVVLLLALVIGLVLYILGALGLMKIADKNKNNHSFFAWIPFLNNYLLGRVAFKSRGFAIALLGLSLIFTPLYGIYYNQIMPKYDSISGTYTLSGNDPASFLSFIMIIVAIVFIILQYIAYYKIYKKMSTKAVAMLVFSILFPVLIPIFLFAIRKNPVRSDI